ncbi:MAG: MATE family efflux transporter [Halanaerobiales bacterium]
MNKNKALIKKPLFSTLMKLSWPIMVGESMHLMYNLADTFWIGRLGADFLAAITVSFPLIFLFFSVGIGFSIAGISLVSQYTGAEQTKKANLAAAQTLMVAITISIIFSIIGSIYGENLLNMLGAEAEILPYAWSYFRIILFVIPLMFTFFIFSATMQAIGDTKTPMYIQLITVTINIIFDPILIFGWGIFPQLGIAGAAIATAITNLIATLISIYVLFSGKKGIHLKLHHLKPDWKMIKKIIRIGLPAALGEAALATAISVLTSLVAGFGTFVLAAYGVAGRITSMIRMPAIGISRATGVLVGQHLGAEQPDQAEKTSWISAGLIFGVMTLVAVIMLLVAPPLVGLFAQETEVIDIGTKYLRIAGFAFSFLGVQMVLGGALSGAGKTMQQTFFNLMTLWGFQVSLSYLLAYQAGMQESGIWWGIFAAKLLGATIMCLWFRKGTWKSRVIENEPEAKVAAEIG